MDELQDYVAKYGAYLEDIRRRVYRIVVVFALVFVAGFFSTAPLVKVLLHYFTVPGATIVATSPFQLLNLAMSAGFFWAVIVTLPLVVQQTYAFLRSGLLKRERRLFLTLIPIGLLLFLTGFSYGFAVMYYALGAVALLNTTLGVTNLWDISQFISQILMTSVLLGVLFEFPLVLTFLIRMGVVSHRFLASKRRHAVVVILIFVTLLPPTDALSDIILVAPLLVIYELTIWINSYGKRVLDT